MQYTDKRYLYRYIFAQTFICRLDLIQNLYALGQFFLSNFVSQNISVPSSPKTSWRERFLLKISYCILRPSVTKDINVKVFNMITKANEAKAMLSNILSDCE